MPLISSAVSGCASTRVYPIWASGRSTGPLDGTASRYPRRARSSLSVWRPEGNRGRGETAISPDTIGDVGSVLGVWGHPDDEAYLSAGLMALAVDAGRRVVCVTATAGEAGFPDDDARSVDARVAVRQAEMAASLAELGVAEHHWLGYGDGRCAEVPTRTPST